MRILLQILLGFYFTSIVTAESSPRIPLESFCSQFALPKVSANNTEARFTGDKADLLFTADSRKVLFNNVILWLNSGVTTSNNKWSIHRVDAETALIPLLLPPYAQSLHTPQKIVIDPGHGGKEKGASGHFSLVEKDLTLDIARRVTDLLSSSNIISVMTREDDTGMTLKERSARIKAMQPDLMVSIHLNSSENPDAFGLETFIAPHAGFPSTSQAGSDYSAQPGNKCDRNNALLSFLIHKAVLDSTSAADRGIKRARFVILNEAPCPAVLVECGFLSNSNEARQLASPEYRQNIADGIATGLLTYISGSQEEKPQTNPLN
jgi:N-acetylmuramoyl-L-alanine amidase